MVTSEGVPWEELLLLEAAEVGELVLLGVDRDELLVLLDFVVPLGLVERIDIHIQCLNLGLPIDLDELILEILEVWGVVADLYELGLGHVLAKLLHPVTVHLVVMDLFQAPREDEIEGVTDLCNIIEISDI